MATRAFHSDGQSKGYREACSRSKVLHSKWKGFTLIELLVVLAIIALLAGLILPALTSANGKSAQIGCLSNYRQLQLCWQLYVDDSEEFLPPNSTLTGVGTRAESTSPPGTWVQGNAWTDTSTANIEAGLLFPYNQSAKIYKCPSDRSTVLDAGKRARSRSVAMSRYMNTITNVDNRECWHRLGEIIDPSPSKAFVFIDEHAGSIDNSRFYATQPDQWRWVDFPSTRHLGGCTLSFADGHAELWKWVEARTFEISRMAGWLQDQRTEPGDRDIRRIHAVVPRIPIQ